MRKTSPRCSTSRCNHDGPTSIRYPKATPRSDRPRGGPADRPGRGDRVTTLKAIEECGFVLTVEEGCLPGGFGSAVLEAASDAGLNTTHVRRLGLPDRFVLHAEREEQLAEVGLDVDGPHPRRARAGPHDRPARRPGHHRRRRRGLGGGESSRRGRRRRPVERDRPTAPGFPDPGRSCDPADQAPRRIEQKMPMIRPSSAAKYSRRSSSRAEPVSLRNFQAPPVVTTP